MTTLWRTDQANGLLQLADVLDLLMEGELPFRFTAYDGSATGPEEAPFAMHLRTQRGAAYLATSPGSLGMARAYVSGDLEISGVHPGDPYRLLRVILNDLHWRTPDARTAARIARSLGVSRLVPPPPPPQETLPEWRRALEGLRRPPRPGGGGAPHPHHASHSLFAHPLRPPT